MKSSGKREKIIYDDSLTRIFLWSGFTMFMLLLIVCIIIGITVLFYRRSDSEGIKIILFCLALVIPGSYGIPFISLLKVWKQERRLGIYWKDRTDYDRPEWERDWYLTCDRGGFILWCWMSVWRSFFNSTPAAVTGGQPRQKFWPLPMKSPQNRWLSGRG